jgi:single-stranded DNA-binding protein
MFNFSGNVGKAAEEKQVGDKTVLNYSVALYSGKDKDGNSQTLWIDCKHWFNGAIPAWQRPDKGDFVIVSGIPAKREWTSQNGSGVSFECTVREVEIKKANQGSGNQSASAPSAPQSAPPTSAPAPSPAPTGGKLTISSAPFSAAVTKIEGMPNGPEKDAAIQAMKEKYELSREQADTIDSLALPF